MACKGICSRYEAKEPLPTNTRYADGRKRCGSCEIYIKWEGVRCPCCNRVLSTGPKHGSLKRKLVNEKLAKVEAHFALMEARQ